MGETSSYSLANVIPKRHSSLVPGRKRGFSKGKLPNPCHLQTAPGHLSSLPADVYACLPSRRTPLVSPRRLPFRLLPSESTHSSHRIGAVIAWSFFLRNKYVSRGKQEAISPGLSGQTMSAISRIRGRRRTNGSSGFHFKIARKITRCRWLISIGKIREPSRNLSRHIGNLILSKRDFFSTG